ncbi:MAG: hypothetical protein FWG66_07840 [Spirochaetes bacterium]|nr:hypothetical protein [Spirochaetota bacterium]
MGMGFSMRFSVKRIGRTKKEYYERIFQNLPSPVPNWNPVYLSDQTGFSVKLAPFESPIFGMWKDNELHVYARTVSAGPGYHAYLVELIDSLNLEPSFVEDETWYHQTRDFAVLQSKMCDWLQKTSETLLSVWNKKGATNLAVSFAADWTPETSGAYACCPLGTFKKSFFESVKNGNEDVSEFFVWWNKDMDAVFYRNMALYMIHCEANWLIPETALEKRMLESTLECFERAYAMDTGLDYPAAEWLELAELSALAGLKAGADVGADLNEAVANSALVKQVKSRFSNIGKAVLGFKRGIIRRSFNGWEFLHSGKMHFDIEDNANPIFWHGERVIRINTVSFKVKGGPFQKSQPKKSEPSNDFLSKTLEGLRPFKLRNKKISAKITHIETEENGQPVFETLLAAAVEGEMFVISVVYRNKEDRKWALEVCESVTRSD